MISGVYTFLREAWLSNSKGQGSALLHSYKWRRQVTKLFPSVFFELVTVQTNHLENTLQIF